MPAVTIGKMLTVDRLRLLLIAYVFYSYEACWKAIMVDTDAVVLVYNPDAPAQDKQLTDWFDFFVKKNGLRDEQCLIFANRPNPTSDRIRPRKFACPV